jgi:hypothetical protein
VAVEDGADGPPFDAKAITQFVYGRSGLVTGDEFLDLVGVELSGSTGLGRSVGGGAGVVGSGSFRSRVQGFYLGFCVVVNSPKVHHCL